MVAGKNVSRKDFKKEPYNFCFKGTDIYITENVKLNLFLIYIFTRA